MKTKGKITLQDLQVGDVIRWTIHPYNVDRYAIVVGIDKSPVDIAHSGCYLTEVCGRDDELNVHTDELATTGEEVNYTTSLTGAQIENLSRCGQLVKVTDHIRIGQLIRQATKRVEYLELCRSTTENLVQGLEQYERTLVKSPDFKPIIIRKHKPGEPWC